ncbi:MAG: type I pullulanase [Bacteroidales bacterium]|jgi:pullulanase|nr:type I pullulanase [Bacteroidales bacterium]
MINDSTYPYYSGDDLGVHATADGFAVKLWAPTATQVDFFVYQHGQGGSPLRIDALRPCGNGVWTLTLNGSFNGLYYTFRVKTAEWLNETPGVDARATGVNGKRGLFFRPADTNPPGWEHDRPVTLASPVDAIIYEVHVRDFSIEPASGMKYAGKYLAFTEQNSRTPDGLTSGMAHLRTLGITHIHLLPVADFHTVDETAPDKQYNWGYDPLNYNTPEGSYATCADGLARIIELKQLVMAAHTAGIGVVLDVVYNHTGHTSRSWFNQTVPGYYYRHWGDGSLSNASGCGNEIASERPMVRKYIVNSLLYWAQEYHIDGFRFDLMGILDLNTMRAIRQALTQVRPDMLLYGEGWAADASPMEASRRAVTSNAGQLPGFAFFNDVFRDAVKGDNFSAWERGFVSGKALGEEPVKFGIVAACVHPQLVYYYARATPWATAPSQCVNYVSSHDNLTLFDKLRACNPEASGDDLRRMHRLAGALTLTSQGIPFLHAGIEFCRTKNGVHNSYRSPDCINKLDWTRKAEYGDVCEYFSRLIALRKQMPAFRMRTADDISRYLHFSQEYMMGVIAYSITNYPSETRWHTICLLFNARQEPVDIQLPESGKWTLIAEDSEINPAGIRVFSGSSINVARLSMSIVAIATKHKGTY